MRSTHLVCLATNEVLSPDWAMSCVLSAYDHELWGPEILRVRTWTLNTLIGARDRIARDRTYPVGDRRHRDV